MICNPCREGGKLANLRGIVSEARASMLLIAKDRHKKCKGGSWCDCQHRVEGK